MKLKFIAVFVVFASLLSTHTSFAAPLASNENSVYQSDEPWLGFVNLPTTHFSPKENFESNYKLQTWPTFYENSNDAFVSNCLVNSSGYFPFDNNTPTIVSLSFGLRNKVCTIEFSSSSTVAKTPDTGNLLEHPVYYFTSDPWTGFLSLDLGDVSCKIPSSSDGLNSKATVENPGFYELNLEESVCYNDLASTKKDMGTFEYNSKYNWDGFVAVSINGVIYPLTSGR